MAQAAAPARQSRHRGLIPVIGTEHALRLALWAILLAAATYTSADPDLWGHVRFGLDILRSGSIPTADPYSFTSDRTWINHEWLAEVVTAGAFTTAGNAGLIAIKLAAIGTMLALLMSVLRRSGVAATLPRDAAAAAAVILTMEQTHHVRPQLFSVVLFAALLWMLTLPADQRRWIAGVPLLFACWANLHGGWLVGGGVLALWTAGGLLAGNRLGIWYAGAGVAALMATLTTPYGPNLWRFLSDTVGFSRADIGEWQPIYALGPDVWVRWSATCALSMVGIFTLTRGTAPRRWAALYGQPIVVIIALAAASFMVTRLQAFFALSALFLTGPSLVAAYARREAASPQPHAAVMQRRLRLAAPILAAAATAFAAVNVGQLRIDPRLTPDPGAVAYLNAQPGGPLLVWFDWGEYAIWHLKPSLRISIDGRRETVYSEALHYRHLRFYYDAPGGASLPDELAASYVWVPRRLPAADRLDTDDRWQRVYQDGQSVIFGRRTNLPDARQTPDADDAGAEPALVARVFPGP